MTEVPAQETAVDGATRPWSPWRQCLPVGIYDLPLLLSSLNAYASDFVFPGGVLGLSREGAQRFYGTFGLDPSLTKHYAIESQPFARLNDIVAVEALTQPVVAVAALVLVERGLLSLEDPVSKYFPEMATIRIEERAEGCTSPVSRQILVRDLFGCGAASSSLDAVLSSASLGATLGPRSVLERFSWKPLRSDAGYAVSLDCPSFDLLGALLEEVADASLHAVVYETVLGPLGMSDSGFYVPEEKQARLAKRLIRWDRGTSGSVFLEVDFLVHDVPSAVPAVSRGGSGLFSTADDYLAFCEMLANGGKYGERQILGTSVLMAFGEVGVGTVARFNGVILSDMEGAEVSLLPLEWWGFWRRGSAMALAVDAQSGSACVLVWPGSEPHVEFVESFMAEAMHWLASREGASLD